MTENMIEGTAALVSDFQIEVIRMETGTVISLVAALIALIALILNSRKETRSDAAALARIDTSLTSLNNGVTDIRVDLRSMQGSLNDHSERLAKVEARAESNTHRLDTLEGK